MNSTIDPHEINKFEKMAEQWWDHNGFFRPLHIMAPTRINYIRSLIEDLSRQDVSIIDVGCGGGLIAEPFAKLGFKVSAIDASDINIRISKAHAKANGLEIDYQCSTVEDYALTGKKFDVVLALEIVEHVSDLPLFIQGLAQIVKNDGLVVISTLNRTLKSYLAAIIGAEYLLKWLPKGTHDWHKFITPGELLSLCQKNNLSLNELKGMRINPITLDCSMSDNSDVNYFASFKKAK